MSHNPDDKRMTHRQLAEMMANGWGEWIHSPSNSGVCYTTYRYFDKQKDQPVHLNNEGQDILVRKWEDALWEFPSEDLYREYKFKREQKITEVDARLDRLDREIKNKGIK